jgi:CHAT domain
MPGLLLSDAVLTVTTLEKRKASTMQLVVLSACDTEDGALGGAEDADSLTGYFVRAGVPRVVASRWNVDSGSARRFMSKFYEHLLYLAVPRSSKPSPLLSRFLVLATCLPPLPPLIHRKSQTPTLIARAVQSRRQ